MTDLGIWLWFDLLHRAVDTVKRPRIVSQLTDLGCVKAVINPMICFILYSMVIYLCYFGAVDTVTILRNVIQLTGLSCVGQ